MPALVTTAAAPPSLQARGERAAVPNAYFAIAVDAAVDLLEAREYRGLTRAERLARALEEQRGFLNGISETESAACEYALGIATRPEPPMAPPLTEADYARARDVAAQRVRRFHERLAAQRDEDKRSDD